MSDSFDPDALVGRFKERTAAVKSRNLPSVGGDERQLFIKQAEADYMDFSIIGDAEAKLEDGVLTLTIDPRPTSSGCRS